MNASDVIRIGRSRSWQASTAARHRIAPLVLELARELDDQNRVLGRQADQHDEADLGEDVDVLPVQRHAEQRAQQAHRHDQDDGERQRPALVLRRQHQEDEQHRQREDE